MDGWRRHALRYGSLGLVVAAFLAGALLSLHALLQLHAHDVATLRIGHWRVAQAQVEYHRLTRALEGHVHGSAPADAVRLRYEILWSRLPLILDGSGSNLVTGLAEVRATAADLLATLMRHFPLIRDMGPEDRAAAEQVLQALEPFEPRLQRMVQAAMHASSDSRAAGDALWRRIVGLLGGTLLAGALLILLLVREARSALRERAKAEIAENRLKQALDSISEGFVLYDADERLVLSNERFRSFYGLADADAEPGTSFEEVIRKTVARGCYRLAGIDSEDWIGQRLALFRAGASRHEQRLSDGRWLEVREHRLPDGSTVGLRIDVTPLKQREQELREALSQVEEASQAKSNFLANMSHELRTPLNAIIGFAELIEEERLGPLGHPNYKEFAADIQQGGRHLLGVINDILDMARIEANQVSLSEETVDLRTLVSAAIRMVWSRAVAKRLSLDNLLGSNLPPVTVDAQKLRQVLINLLSNAIKFTPPEGRVWIEGRLSEDGVELSIHDSGIGMDETQIPVALLPFRQIDSAMSRQFEGTGLGLPISQALIRRHGGDLSIESSPGRGTTVRISLPRERIAIPPLPAL